MTITDTDEWLRAGAASDEVALAVDGAASRLVLRAHLTVTPGARRVHLTVELDEASAEHRAEEAGPPNSNWDRMRIGRVEWRMVEVLRQWELTADDPETGLRAYLTFSGTSPCTPLPDGYAQEGMVSGQLELSDQRATISGAPARRWHVWR